MGRVRGEDWGILSTMVNTDRRVVVTGIGVVAPNGNSLPEFWQSVVDGRSAARHLTRFNASAMPCKLACEVRDFDPTRWMEEKKAKRFDRSIIYGIAAGKQALKDSGLDLSRMDPDRFGIVEGTSVSGIDNTLEAHVGFMRDGYKSIRPTELVNAFCGGGSSELAIELGVTCQATTITTACSAGNDAIGYGLRAIRDDLADVMLAGAAEAPIVDGYYAIFAKAGVMTRRQDDPARAMKPFDRDRDGFVLGEGSAFLQLEELGHALARGADIYCEIVGHGQACDAHSIVGLHPEAKGSIAAFRKALYDARLTADHISYINAHGSATGTNDVLESKAINAVLGARARKVPVSGTKPITGHLAGAAAAVEAAICAMAIRHRIVPPTANLENPAEGCNLDYVPDSARAHPIDCAASLSAGFGGKHSALLLRRYTG